MQAAVDNLPTCTELIPNIDPSGGTIELPDCLPAIILGRLSGRSTARRDGAGH